MEEILALQRSVIRAELAALEHARARLPGLEERNWVGDARAAYALTLHVLHSDLTRAIEQLRAALAQTTRAIETVTSR